MFKRKESEQAPRKINQKPLEGGFGETAKNYRYDSDLDLRAEVLEVHASSTKGLDTNFVLSAFPEEKHEAVSNLYLSSIKAYNLIKGKREENWKDTERNANDARYMILEYIRSRAILTRTTGKSKIANMVLMYGSGRNEEELQMISGENNPGKVRKSIKSILAKDKSPDETGGTI
jgi:hypothetical protein